MQTAKFKWWIAITLYLFIVFGLSTIPGETFQKIPHFPEMDKGVHMVLYGGLGFLLAQKFPVIWTLLINAAIGAADENYQRGTPDRECSIYDWLADMVGAVLGILILKKMVQRKEKSS